MEGPVGGVSAPHNFFFFFLRAKQNDKNSKIIPPISAPLMQTHGGGHYLKVNSKEPQWGFFGFFGPVLLLFKNLLFWFASGRLHTCDFVVAHESFCLPTKLISLFSFFFSLSSPLRINRWLLPLPSSSPGEFFRGSSTETIVPGVGFRGDECVLKQRVEIK